MSPALLSALGGLCALALGIGIGRFAYTPLLPFMRAELDLSIETAGYIASANFAGYLFGALIAIGVPLAKRRLAFICAILGSALTTWLMALPGHELMFAAIRFVSGFASAFVLIHGSAIVLDRLALEQRPGLSGLLYAGVGSGIAASAVIVALCSALGAGSTQLWMALGLACLILAPLALGLRDPAANPGASLVPNQAVPARSSSLTHPSNLPGPGVTLAGRGVAQQVAASRDHADIAKPAAEVLRKRALNWLILAYGCLGFGYVITATFIVVIVRAQPQWQAWEMLVWLIVGLTAAPSNWLWLRVTQRYGPWRAMIAAYLLEAAGVAAAVSGQSFLMVLLGAALLGGTFMGITALGLTTARQLSRGASGPVIAKMTVAFSLGQIVGPSVGGWLAARTNGFGTSSMIAAASLVAAAWMIAVAGRRAAQAETQASG